MLTIKNVSKSFADRTASNVTPILRTIDLTVQEGEIACLLGPSGCGKTTLLRIIAGLETADEGGIAYQGENLAGVPVHLRRFGFMFQDFALLPHKTVGQNIAFGLRMQGWARADIQARVAEMLELVNMAGYQNRSPLSLSGGEQQRVALARSLAPNPCLLMLDEPLGSLDRGLRESLMNDLRAILKQVGVTAVYVTHDQDEAYAVADKLIVMNKGQIMQVGAPAELYSQPANPFVARFLGFTNLLEGKVQHADLDHIETALGRWPLKKSVEAGAYTCLLRPTGAKLLAQGENLAAIANQFILTGTLTQSSFRGPISQIDLQVPAEDGSHQTLDFELATEQFQSSDFAVGQSISLLIDASQVVLIG